MGKRGRPKKDSTIKMARWTVIVPFETKIAVTKAASREGYSLHAWIDKGLLRLSQEVLTGKQEIAKPEDVADIVKLLVEKIDKISERVNDPWWKKFRKK